MFHWKLLQRNSLHRTCRYMHGTPPVQALHEMLRQCRATHCRVHHIRIPRCCSVMCNLAYSGSAQCYPLRHPGHTYFWLALSCRSTSHFVACRTVFVDDSYRISARLVHVETITHTCDNPLTTERAYSVHPVPTYLRLLHISIGTTGRVQEQEGNVATVG